MDYKYDKLFSKILTVNLNESSLFEINNIDAVETEATLELDIISILNLLEEIKSFAFGVVSVRHGGAQNIIRRVNEK